MGGERGGGELVGETLLNNIFKNGFIFLKCTDYRDFFSKIVLIVRIFSKILQIFKKMYVLYGFFSKIVRIVRISSENERIFVRIFSKMC